MNPLFIAVSFHSLLVLLLAVPSVSRLGFAPHSDFWSSLQQLFKMPSIGGGQQPSELI
jgi:hypothetical protein